MARNGLLPPPSYLASAPAVPIPQPALTRVYHHHDPATSTRPHRFLNSTPLHRRCPDTTPATTSTPAPPLPPTPFTQTPPRPAPSRHGPTATSTPAPSPIRSPQPQPHLDPTSATGAQLSGRQDAAVSSRPPRTACAALSWPLWLPRSPPCRRRHLDSTNPAPLPPPPRPTRYAAATRPRPNTTPSSLVIASTAPPPTLALPLYGTPPPVPLYYSSDM
ncbi:hypothetical protein EDB84DRAFT_1560206 [Lactarius hengduanensis]|nr:hypothetical protein EDB84DRAFT_1560206 [Lactarius hengduanensis]